MDQRRARCQRKQQSRNAEQLLNEPLKEWLGESRMLLSGIESMSTHGLFEESIDRV